MIRIILALIVFLILYSCNPPIKQNGKLTTEQKTILDSLHVDLEKIWQQGTINGFAVAIVDSDSFLYQRGFGYADIEANIPYTVNTVQNIASISKTFLGISLLKAQELGKLQLDDPINKYLPFSVINPSHPDIPITIRHLATHTSTIKDTNYYYVKAYILKDASMSDSAIAPMGIKLNNPDSGIDLETYLEKVLSKEGEWYSKEGFLDRPPGELFEYSNIGTALAALVLEKATQVNYATFSRNHILMPLKMTESGWFFNEIDMQKHSKLYLDALTEIPWYRLITYPDGGMITCTNDLGKYMIELIRGYQGNGILLKPEGYNEFFTKQLKSENFLTDHGENEGIFLSFTPDGHIGHSGGDPGVSTYMFFNPQSGIGRILFVNTVLDNIGAEQYRLILRNLDSRERQLYKIMGSQE